MSVERRHLFVSGRVQGVWFRQSCAEEARRHGVTGWVRNCPDGRVEAVFEGDPTPVDAMVAWCHHGPVHAHVYGVEVNAETPEGFTNFRVAGGD